MAGICTSSYSIEKVGDSPYTYPYPVNEGIFRQNGDRFEQYPRDRIYLPSLAMYNICLSVQLKLTKSFRLLQKVVESFEI